MSHKLCAVVCVVLVVSMLSLGGCIVINPPTDAAADASPSPALEIAEQTPAPTAELAQTAEPTASAQPTATTEPTDTAEPTPAPSGVTEKKLGYVQKAYSKDGVNYIDIDYVEMYTGQEAIKKALEDGSDAVYQYDGQWTIDNDYYLRNNNTLIRTFPVDAACKFEVVDTQSQSSTDGIPFKTVSFSDFVKLVKMRSSYLPLMHVTIENGVLVSAQEQFLP